MRRMHLIQAYVRQRQLLVICHAEALLEGFSN